MAEQGEVSCAFALCTAAHIVVHALGLFQWAVLPSRVVRDSLVPKADLLFT